MVRDSFKARRKGYKITSGPASRRISAACVVIAARIAVETWNLVIPASSASAQGPSDDYQLHLHHDVEDREWCWPHKRDELRGGGRDERSG